MSTSIIIPYFGIRFLRMQNLLGVFLLHLVSSTYISLDIGDEPENEGKLVSHLNY